jgi:hypothetical protein
MSDIEVSAEAWEASFNGLFSYLGSPVRTKINSIKMGNKGPVADIDVAVIKEGANLDKELNKLVNVIRSKTSQILEQHKKYGMSSITSREAALIVVATKLDFFRGGEILGSSLDYKQHLEWLKPWEVVAEDVRA